MSKALQALKTQVNRARNLSYFGKYLESTKEFEKIIEKVESEIFRINDKLLISEWNKLLNNMRFEKGLAQNMISTLTGDFQHNRPKKQQSVHELNQQYLQQQRGNFEQPIENARHKQNLGKEPFKKQSYDDQQMQRLDNGKQKYPFGKEPFKRQVYDDDQFERQRQQQRLDQEQRNREFQRKQAEIWPKKEPKKAKKNPTHGYNAFNNKSNCNHNPSVSNNNNANDRREYDRPWLKNAGGKKKDKEGQEKKTFLKQCYPDGQGPDSDLIALLEREVVDFSPNITFDDIAELQKAKDVLQEAVLLPLAMPQLFQGIRRAWKGVLLFGPPGTGKTLLAKAIASTGKTTFFNVTSSSLASKWKGESEKMVRILFEMAKFYAPTTIFIDQIDALASKRGQKEDQSSRKVKTQLMTRIDGATTGNSNGDQNKLIVVIGATNRPWDLDEAIRRRLEKRIYIPLPTEIGRRQMVKISLKDQKVEQNLDIEEIVRKTDGYSGADIANLCREAAYMPMRRKLKKQGGLGAKIKDANWQEEFQKEVNVPLSMEDFNEAIRNVKPSVGKGDLANYEEWMKQFGEQGTK